MPDWIMVLITFSWGGPIGLGALLAGLGIYNWGLAQKKIADRE